jgi:prepilin-type processing-associated H-X9-DG protein
LHERGSPEPVTSFPVLPVTSSTILHVPAADQSYHSGGLVNVVLMDGSVRNIVPTVNPATWRVLGRRNGTEMIGEQGLPVSQAAD